MRKPKRNKRTPKPKKEVRPAREIPQLDINKVFEEIVAQDKSEVKQKRRRNHKRRDLDVDVDPLVTELIHRIEQIYMMNNYDPGNSNLMKLNVKQLRTHLDRLQWGHIPYITKENKFPPIDEFPVNGFCCTSYGYDLWVNSQHCESRAMYPKLYSCCSDCSRWRDNESNSNS